MNKNVDYSNLVRTSFAKTAYINPSDIDMHTALWMYEPNLNNLRFYSYQNPFVLL